MFNRKSRKVIFIYHSQKLVDERVFSVLPSFGHNEIEFLNLANTAISIELVKEIAAKMSDWQNTLLDARYMDHSIKYPEKEFLSMDDPHKILFLKNNSWLIGTPLVIDNDKVFRFHKVSDVTEWLKVKKIIGLKDLTESIEVPSAL